MKLRERVCDNALCGNYLGILLLVIKGCVLIYSKVSLFDGSMTKIRLIKFLTLLDT